jgi:hypothetical protein
MAREIRILGQAEVTPVSNRAGLRNAMMHERMAYILIEGHQRMNTSGVGFPGFGRG